MYEYNALFFADLLNELTDADDVLAVTKQALSLGITTKEIENELAQIKQAKAQAAIDKMMAEFANDKPEVKKESDRVWVDSDAAYKIGVTVASNANESGRGGSWFNRKVTSIKNVDGENRGQIKLNHKIVNVYQNADKTWSVSQF